MVSKLILLFESLQLFLHWTWLVGFHKSLSDSKFSQISRTLQNILADFSSAVVWIFKVIFQLYYETKIMFNFFYLTFSPF